MHKIDDKALEKLILQLSRMWQHRLYNWFGLEVDFEDVKSEVGFIIANSLYHFDEGRNVKFITYAAKAVTNRMLRFSNVAMRQRRLFTSLDEFMTGTQPAIFMT